MSNSKKPRVIRGDPPKKTIKRHKYREALPELMRDFEGRCAYSMQHHTRCGALEVDHFDPRQKKELIQRYENLFPASRFCNGKKSDNWPSRAEAAAGCRFLNPCKEMDYGEHIFEDPVTHLLVGNTVAGRWHIRMCGLNAAHLVQERARRAKYRAQYQKTRVVVRRADQEFRELSQSFWDEIQLMIPEIPAAPK